MVTDLVEIRRLGDAKAEENLEFRRYLAAHHERIESFQALAAEIERHIDCTACANCCRNATVEVKQPEIEAIARHLGIAAEDVEIHYTVDDPDAPAMRVLKSTREGCVFLSGNLCTVYEARPTACRNFPQVEPGRHSLGARLPSLCRWAPVCPIVYNAIEAYKHLVGYHSGQHR